MSSAPNAPRQWVPSHSFEYGGHTYTLVHAPGRVSLRATARMGNVIAPLFEGITQGAGPGRLAHGAAWVLAQRSLGDDLEALANLYAPYTTVNGRELAPMLDEHFAGRMMAMRKWLEEVVQFECGDFLDDVSAELGKILSPPPAADSSSSTSPRAAAKIG